jgi:histidyl-tRNA synthetase
MPDQDKRLKARLPRGFADRSAADIRATERMVATIRSVYERYGFEPAETPLVEFTETLGKFLPDQDRPNAGVFSFKDDPGSGSGAGGDDERSEWLSLRYDLTAPLARQVAENWERLPKPWRSYRQGWVFRNEKPGPGRFRQFMQFDADIVGSASPAADAEMCMMMADTMEALGIPRGEYAIQVSSRKVLDGLLEIAGLAGDENGKRRMTVLRAIDKLDRLGWDGVNALLGAGRLDESGDFTPGAGLDAEQIAGLSMFFLVGGAVGFVEVEKAGTSFAGRPVDDFVAIAAAPEKDGEFLNADAGPARTLDNRRTLESWADALSDSTRGSEGVAELRQIVDLAEASGYGSRRIQLSGSVVRGLEYYTGPVFEAQLLARIPNEKGQPVVFGSVGGGGRYDGLVGRFMAENVPATGFSIGVSRLQAALTALGKLGDAGAQGPVVVLVMDKERTGDYQKMVADLRNAGIAAELYLGSAGMKAQMKYADRRNAPLAIIQGGDERAKGVVQIKDLAVGKRAAAAIADNTAWREERPGQIEVAEADLVAAVKRMLGQGS